MIYLELFLTFLKIGAFTFGGGYAMVPLIQEEVINHGWMSMSDLVNFIAVSESTPGPFAVNAATYIGASTAGILGALASTLGVVLPSLIIIIFIAKFFTNFSSHPAVKGLMSGLKPAVIGLIGSALISIGYAVFFAKGLSFTVFQQLSFYVSLVIFVISLILIFRKISPIVVILISAILGIISGYIGLI